ncbi:MAG: GNAT family N-acetyltransferase, partial [Eubacteriales bacterium]|nr:GNAT family N-acetyltransferase [Eubacteriales bacterium]
MIRRWIDRDAQVWLTDEEDEALRLSDAGECVVFVLTRQNRAFFSPRIRYAVEEPGNPEDSWLYRVWQRFSGQPWEIAATRRLLLREMTEADLEALYELQPTGEESAFLEPLEEDRRAQRERIRAYREHMYGLYEFGIWMAVERQTGRIVGRAGLQLREGFEEPELGFLVGKDFRGQGYAGEACRAVLAYASEELGLSAVRAVVHRDNRKSLRLCEKLGFAVDNR